MVPGIVQYVIQLGIAAGFLGLGLLGVGLMVGAAWYPTGILWGIVVFFLGLFGVLLAAGYVMTFLNKPTPERPSV